MKKIIAIIIALLILSFSFSGCSEKIVNGNFTMQPGGNVVKIGSQDTTIKRYNSYEEKENDIKNYSYGFLAKVEVAGDSFNFFYRDGILDDIYECMTITPVRIKELYHLGENISINVGDIVYTVAHFIYIDDEYYNAELKDHPWAKPGDYVMLPGGIYEGDCVPLQKGYDYLLGGTRGYYHNNLEDHYTITKDGIEFYFYFETLYSPVQLTGTIDRSLYSDYCLMFYDGAVAKYGNK